MTLVLSLTFLSFVVVVSCTQVLLVTTAIPNTNLPTCLGRGFLGSYGSSASDRYSVYRCSVECTTDAQLENSLDAARIIPIEENTRLVYIQEAGVEQSVRGDQGTFTYELGTLVARVQSSILTSTDASHPQHIFSPAVETMIMHQTATSALVSVPDFLLPKLDTLLPRLFVPVVLPIEPLPLLPVPASAVKRVAGWLASLHFDPDVASIIDHLSIPQMLNDIRFLTGEDGTSGIMSRHSFTEGALTAAKWIQGHIETTGATCELRPFLTGFAPNVICRYPSTVNTTATVILSAHYDSRGTFGSTRAPGGDDDGSGVLSLLGIARAIQSKRLSFQSNVELVAFAGEEQGLLGSRAYAQELRDADANVTLMIQADMLAYRKPDEPLQLGLPDRIGTKEVAQLVANVSGIYSPELAVGYTPACCSDHQTFHEQGFPSTQVFERAGPIVDPMYHNSGDLSNRTGYDLAQVRSIAKVTFATLLHAAGFDIQAEAEGSE